MGIEFKKRIHEGGSVAVAAAPLRAYPQLFEVVILMEEEFLIEILLVQANVLKKVAWRFFFLPIEPCADLFGGDMLDAAVVAEMNDILFLVVIEAVFLQDLAFFRV